MTSNFSIDIQKCIEKKNELEYINEIIEKGYDVLSEIFIIEKIMIGVFNMNSEYIDKIDNFTIIENYNDTVTDQCMCSNTTIKLEFSYVLKETGNTITICMFCDDITCCPELSIKIKCECGVEENIKYGEELNIYGCKEIYPFFSCNKIFEYEIIKNRFNEQKFEQKEQLVTVNMDDEDLNYTLEEAVDTIKTIKQSYCKSTN